MRLDKFLANSGVGTRSEVRKIIKKNIVKVNDILVNDISFNIDEKKDVVLVKDKIVGYKPFLYIMLNKPKDVISATFDDKLKTVVDLLGGKYRTYDIFPVGRLDIDTEGLIILTNDGELSHQLLSPKKHIAKKYYVECEKVITDSQAFLITKGVDIGGYLTKDDAKIEVLSSNSCYLTITEGKFHQVKKMFEAVGNKVNYLKRVSMNKLTLDENLNLGEFRELTEEELLLLKGGL